MIEIRITNKIEDKVKEYIEKYGTTKTWMAKQLNISKQTLNTIMKSKNPTVETMVKFSVLLDCDVSELYEAEILQDGMIVKFYKGKSIIHIQK